MRVIERTISIQHLKVGLFGVSLVASLFSFIVFMQGAHDEPYFTFRATDVMSQVGAACALIVTWLYVACAVCFGVVTRRLHVAWLLLLVWSVIVILYMRSDVLGYLGDISRNVKFR
jgi:Fe2+ transport system protein B